MRRVIAFKNLIEIPEIEVPGAITLLLRLSNLDPLPEHVQELQENIATIDLKSL